MTAAILDCLCVLQLKGRGGAEAATCNWITFLFLFRLQFQLANLVLQLRGLGGGAAATCNWITNAVVSQTFLTLVQHMGGSGTFWLYAVIALAGAVWVYFALPETKGKTMC